MNSAHLKNLYEVKTIDFYARLKIDANDRSYTVKVNPYSKTFTCERKRKTHIGKVGIRCDVASALFSSSEKVIKAVARDKCLLNISINGLNGPANITPLTTNNAYNIDDDSRSFYLKGTWEKGEYEIPMYLLNNDSDQNNVLAKVSVDGQKNKDIPVVFDGLIPNLTNLGKIRKILSSLEKKPDRLKIKINYNNGQVSCVIVKIPDPNSNVANHPAQLSNKSILNITSAQEAIDILNAGHAHPNFQVTKVFIETAIRQHILKLKQDNIGYTEELNEYVQLPEKLNNPEQIRMILTAFLENCTNEIVDKREYLKAVQYILDSLQKRFFRGLMGNQASAADPIAENPQSVLDPEMLIAIMRILTKALRNLTVEPGNIEKIIIYFKTLNALLGTMMFFEMKSGRRKEHMEFCDDIKYFISHNNNNLEISYLAHYALQAVIRLPDDQSTAKSLLRRVFHIVKGCAIIADAIDPTTSTPWTMALHLPRAIFESVGEFRKGFKIDGKKWQWFHDLNAILEKTDTELKALINDILLPVLPGKYKELRLSSHKFMYGLVSLLKNTLNTPNISKDFAKAINDLLEKIWTDNRGNKKGIFTLKADKNQPHKANKYKAQLCAYIVDCICSTKASSDIVIAKLSDDLFKKLNIGVYVSPPQSISFVKPITTNLFKNALEEVDPTLKNIRAMRDELANDAQLSKEIGYYISLQGIDEKDIISNKGKPNSYDMEGRINRFLSEKNKRMLLMLGKAGSGKSLFTKMFAFTKLDLEYNPDEYLPIHVYLPSFKENFSSKKLLQGVLKTFGFDIETDPVLRVAFHQRKILWVLDSYDEIDFEGNRQKPLSSIIDFENWPNSKFLVTCRTEKFIQVGLDKFKIIEENTSPDVVYTVDFDATNMKAYFKKYVEVYKKRNTSFPWTFEDYEKVIAILEKIPFVKTTLLKNPLMIKLLAYTIPLMITKNGSLDSGKLEAEVKKQFSGNPHIIDNHIKHTMAAFIAERSYRKYKHIDELKAVNFLSYTAEFAKKLREKNMNGCKWPLHHSVRDIFSKFFDDSINKLNYIFVNNCLSYRNGEWTLEHDELITYYARLIGGIDGDDYDLVEDLRKSDDFQKNYNAVHGYK